MRAHWRWLLPALGLALPLLGLRACSVSLAERWGSAAASELHGLSQALPPAPGRAALPPPAPGEVEVVGEALSADVGGCAQPAAVPSPPPRAIASPREHAPSKGVFVRKARVLALANAGAMPDGAPVPAGPEHPAGLLLSGVGALGVGMRDGDVLTHVAGRPARGRADVVGTVVAARNARAPSISARFWRDGEPWNLIVELPYPDRRRAR